MEKQPPWRTGSREVSSRFLSTAAASMDARPLSPSRRSVSKPQRTTPNSTTHHRLWPAASKKSSSSGGTLADHLGNDRLIDLVHRHDSSDSPLISRQRSCSELRRFDDREDDKERDKAKEKEKKHGGSKENHRPIGGSMRYIGKLRFPRSPQVDPTSPSSSTLAPPRISVDETALANRRRNSDFALDFPSSESERSESYKLPTQRAPRPTKKYEDTKSAEWNPMAKTAVRRSSSLTTNYGSVVTQWALSPGRQSGSPPMADNGARPAAAGVRSFSSLRPPSPGKGRGVGNLISMGLDLFRRKSFSGSSSPSSSPAFGITTLPAGGVGVMVVGEIAHQLRMMHGRLIQWRYVKARSDTVSSIKMANTQTALMSAWAGISKLQASVVQKRLQLEKQKLGLKLNKVLSSQMKPLEGWGDLERQHMSDLTTTKDCLQAAVSRLPLIEGAKADLQPMSAALQQASDLVLTIKSTISIFNPTAENRVPVLWELAQVVTREKTLLEECLELLHLVSTLQIQEHSLKCHVMQLKSLQIQGQLDAKKHYNNQLVKPHEISDPRWTTPNHSFDLTLYMHTGGRL